MMSYKDGSLKDAYKDKTVYNERKRSMGSTKLKFNILSLFSGCGGLDLGFTQLGSKNLDLEIVDEQRRKPCGDRFEVVWANDIYEPACSSYALNFNAELYTDPDEDYQGRHRVFHGDITKASYKKAVKDTRIDMVLGGFPCQDFSLIRGTKKRLGIQVKRGRLYLHFVRSLVYLQPKMFLAENVRGLVSANKGLAYKQILDDFENLNVRWNDIETEYKDKFPENSVSKKLQGYEILFSDVTNFANFGVPQKRERLIIIGLRKDLLKYFKNIYDIKGSLKRSIDNRNSMYATYPLTPIEVFNGKTLDRLKHKYESIILEYIKDIIKINTETRDKYFKEKLYKYNFNIWNDYFTLNRIGSNSPFNVQHAIIKAHKEILLKTGFYNNELNKNYKLPDDSTDILSEKEHVVERMRHIPPGENHLFVRDTEYHVQGLMSNIYRRIHPLLPAYTVIARGGGGTWGYHFVQDRQKMTNRERARLQTFPDSFYFSGRSGEVRRQIGEAVPPLAAYYIAKEICKILDKMP